MSLLLKEYFIKSVLYMCLYFCHKFLAEQYIRNQLNLLYSVISTFLVILELHLKCVHVPPHSRCQKTA